MKSKDHVLTTDSLREYSYSVQVTKPQSALEHLFFLFDALIDAEQAQLEVDLSVHTQLSISKKNTGRESWPFCEWSIEEQAAAGLSSSDDVSYI